MYSTYTRSLRVLFSSFYMAQYSMTMSRNTLIDISITILLCIGIITWQLQPTPTPHITIIDNQNQEQTISPPAIIQFWSIENKPSHRYLQIIRRFTLAHKDIQTVLISPSTEDQNTNENFLVSLGIYDKPYTSSYQPQHIPETILLSTNGTTVILDHPPHYELFMEFFGKEH